MYKRQPVQRIAVVDRKSLKKIFTMGDPYSLSCKHCLLRLFSIVMIQLS